MKTDGSGDAGTINYRYISGDHKCMGRHTYNPPKRNIPSTLSFRVMGIWRFHTTGIGAIRMIKSVTTLAEPVPM